MSKLDPLGLFAVFLLGTVLPARAQSPEAPFQVEAPDKGIVSLRLSADWEVHGEVTYSVTDRDVEIVWYYQDHLGRPRRSWQREAVSFWPTEVASFGPDALLVGGMNTETGAASIHLWRFVPPQRPLPYTSTQTGQTHFPMLQVQIESKTLLHRVQDRGPVWVLLKNQGTQCHVFVQYWKDRNLYALDVVSKTMTKVYSVAAEGSLPVLPELAETRRIRWSRNHSTEGYVYYLGDVSGDRGLILFDSDRDGGIDEVALLTTEQFWARELDVAAGYLEFY